LAMLAHREGHRVVGVDVDESKLQNLPFQAGIHADLVRGADTIVICVPTPVFEDHSPNFEYLESACGSVAPHLSKGQLVIIESTVNPGVTETIVLSFLEKGSGLKGGTDFFLAHCPERISPGDKDWSVENIPRVVGSLEKHGLDKAMAFYESILRAPIKPMQSLQEAEAVKVVENSFRDINIAFVNELAMSFSRLGIDVVSVLEGAATKPFSFLPHVPGCGVGGHCIPVDPYYLIAYAEKNGFHHDFLALARNINNKMPAFTVDLLLHEIGSQRGKVAVLGIAYKPDIEDWRESPSFEIEKHLKKAQCEPVLFDPFVPRFSQAQTIDEALEGSIGVIVATAHSQFVALEPEVFLRRGVQVVIDGRNCLDKQAFKDAGIRYKGIGR
jgi:UDP-N-acetyl-D-glucosamine dehydrogenase